jgi:hypothetical protein
MVFHVLRTGVVRPPRKALGVTALVLALAFSRPAAAQDPDAAVQRMIELNRKALTSFQGKDFEGAKNALLEAVTAGKDAGLTNDRMMARTYLHLGAVLVDGLKDRARGVRYFQLALKIRPDINITPSLVTPTLTEAFEQAKRGGAAPPPDALAKVPAAPPKVAAAPAPEPPKAAPVAAAAPAPSEEKTGKETGDEPDLPATLPQPLYCPNPDEAPPEKRMVLRCVARTDVAVSRVLLFYRLPGGEKFTAVTTKRTRRGWFNGTIPEDAATGKSVQYYFEARDAADKAVAQNGRDDSPNLMLIRDGAPEVGESALGVRISRGRRDTVDEENPIEEVQREKERAERLAGMHRRHAKTFYVGLGLGSGWGWHRAARLEYRTDLQIEAGMGFSGLLHLAPELGYQISDDFSVSLQGRDQVIPTQGSKNSDPGNGEPAKGAHSILLKVSYALFGDNTRVLLSGIAGIGEGFRLVVPPKRNMDVTKDLPRNDSIRGGPGLVGGGLSLVHHWSPHLAGLLDLKTLVGTPDSAIVVDFAAAFQVSF